MNKKDIFALANKVKETGLKGTAKVVSAVNGQTPQDAKKLVQDKVEDVKLYTAESINAAEEFLEEHDAAGKLHRALDKAGQAYDHLKSSSDKVADHFTNDHFDEQTAEIREQLANQKGHDDEEADIIIDATSDDKDRGSDDSATSSDDIDKEESKD